jgi:hypothetical protein
LAASTTIATIQRILCDWPPMADGLGGEMVMALFGHHIGGTTPDTVLTNTVRYEHCTLRLVVSSTGEVSHTVKVEERPCP